MSVPDYLFECSHCDLSETLQRAVPKIWYCHEGLTYEARPEIGWCFDCMTPQWRVPGLSILTLHENIRKLKRNVLQVGNNLLSMLFDYSGDLKRDYKIREIQKRLGEYRQVHSLGFCYSCGSTHILELAYPLSTNTHIGCQGHLIEKRTEYWLNRFIEDEYYEPIFTPCGPDAWTGV